VGEGNLGFRQNDLFQSSSRAICPQVTLLGPSAGMKEGRWGAETTTGVLQGSRTGTWRINQIILQTTVTKEACCPQPLLVGKSF
jgi:hypothetical protein